MEGGSQRKWVSAGFLAIILPMGLLVGFKLTGIITEPYTAIDETTIAETVEFAMEKPTYNAHPGVRTRNDYQNEEVQAELCISLDYELGVTGMNVTAVANVSLGFVSSMRLTFCETDPHSQIYLLGGSPNSGSYTPYFYRLENLSIEESVYCFNKWWLLENNTRAYIKAKGIDQPSQTRFSTYLDWYLTNWLNQTHQLEITLTLTYWNTSCYKELVLPIVLSLQPDSSSFEDSSELTYWTSTPVEYKAFLGIDLPDPGINDPDDYYRVNVPERYLLTIGMLPPANANFDLYLYYGNNPSPVASSTNPEKGGLEFISYKGFAGTYYIRAKCVSSFGFYTLSMHIQYHFGPPPPRPLSTNTTNIEPG